MVGTVKADTNNPALSFSYKAHANMDCFSENNDIGNKKLCSKMHKQIIVDLINLNEMLTVLSDSLVPLTNWHSPQK